MFRVCNRLDHASLNLHSEEGVFLKEFCGSIVHYLDRRNYSANLGYCHLMSVDKSCFEPENGLDSLPSVSDLVQVAHDTAEHRNQKDIDDFLLMSENAFMNAARAEIIST